MEADPSAPDVVGDARVELPSPAGTGKEQVGEAAPSGGTTSAALCSGTAPASEVQTFIEKSLRDLEEGHLLFALMSNKTRCHALLTIKLL